MKKKTTYSFDLELIESSPVGILCLDNQGIITYENTALRKIMGVPENVESPVIGKNICELQSIKDAGIVPALNDLLKGLPISGEVFRYHSLLGPITDIELHAKAFKNDEGLVTGAILNVLNVTEKKQKELEFIKSREALENSEERYRTLVEQSNDMIWAIDTNGNLTYANRRCEEVTGFRFSDWEGKSFIPLIPEEHLPPTMEIFHALIKGESRQYELYLKTSEGDKKLIYANSVPVLRAGEINGAVSFGRDITEIRKVENALKSSEKKYRELVENSLVGIFKTNLKGQILFCNEAMVRIFEYGSVENMILSPVQAVYRNAEDRLEILKKIKQDGRITNQEVEVVTKTGRNIVVEFIMTLDGDELSGMFIEITGRKRAETITRANEKRIQAQLYLYQNSHLSLEKLCRFAVEQAVGLSKSQLGFIGFLNSDESVSHTYIWPEKFAEESGINNNPAECKIADSGIWAEAVRQHQSIIINDHSLLNVGEEGFPTGHVTLRRFMSIPVIRDGHAVIVAGIANKSDNYYANDINQISLFLEGFWEIIQNRRSKENLLKFRLGAERSEDIIFMTDSDGKIIYINPAFTQIYGYTREEALGKTPRILKSGILSEDVYKSFWQSLIEKKVISGEIINKTKEGRLITMRSSANPIIDHDGTMIGFLAIQHDVTQEKQTEQALIQAKEKAEESDRLKSAFLATMSHELRTPLNAVIGFSQVIDENTPWVDAFDMINRIRKSGEHLLSIIEEMFDVTMIESGQVSIKIEEFHISSFMENIHEMLKIEQKEANKQNLEIIVQLLPEDHDIHIKTDRFKLGQILMNLLKNALKFTQEGSIEYGYVTEIQQNTHFVKFFVKDTGIGISKKAQEIIFNIFRQADDSHTRRYGGTGIGLTVAKKLTELLGGRIWVDSKEGAGSTFYFTIPYFPKGIVPQPEKIVFDSLKNLTFPGKTILVAEDNDDSFELLEVLLTKLQVKPLWAKNGREALELCISNPGIDMVLMDIKMPDMTGYEATRLIKEVRPVLPVIAQTAYALYGDEEKSENAGCDDYITKPINRKRLLEILEKYLVNK